MATMLELVLGLILLLPAAVGSPPEPPPILPPPDLSRALVVTVLDAQGGDGLVVQKADNSYLPIRLSGVRVDREDDARRHMAWAFLHNLLAGEQVWIVRADPPKPGTIDACHVYRWPDRSHVNLEMVRQGYADLSADKLTPQAAEVFTYWRDQARRHHRASWALDGQAAATLPAITPRVVPATQSSAAAAPASQPVASVSAADKTTVYVSPSGKKYHTADCKALRGTKTPKTLEEVRRTHQPCKICNPPQ